MRATFQVLSSWMNALTSAATNSSSMGVSPRPNRTGVAPYSSSKHTLGSSLLVLSTTSRTPCKSSTSPAVVFDTSPVAVVVCENWKASTSRRDASKTCSNAVLATEDPASQKGIVKAAMTSPPPAARALAVQNAMKPFHARAKAPVPAEAIVTPCGGITMRSLVLPSRSTTTRVPAGCRIRRQGRVRSSSTARLPPLSLLCCWIPSPPPAPGYGNIPGTVTPPPSPASPARSRSTSSHGRRSEIEDDTPSPPPSPFSSPPPRKLRPPIAPPPPRGATGAVRALNASAAV
mmetsp:Transcript_22968/g.56917  ORF Transcript_22968/g.56917 Transcript_22968/m.56917 type:complete len:289 (-) Transcript_22968:826-1692(-)